MIFEFKIGSILNLNYRGIVVDLQTFTNCKIITVKWENIKTLFYYYIGRDGEWTMITNMEKYPYEDFLEKIEDRLK